MNFFGPRISGGRAPPAPPLSDAPVKGAIIPAILARLAVGIQAQLGSYHSHNS